MAQMKKAAKTGVMKKFAVYVGGKRVDTLNIPAYTAKAAKHQAKKIYPNDMDVQVSPVA